MPAGVVPRIKKSVTTLPSQGLGTSQTGRLNSRSRNERWNRQLLGRQVLRGMARQAQGVRAS